MTPVRRKALVDPAGFSDLTDLRGDEAAVEVRQEGGGRRWRSYRIINEAETGRS